MHTFRIIFTGLKAIVPRGGDLADPANFPTSLTVLLPNLLKPCVLRGLDLILPSHFPLLQFNLDNLRPTNDQPTFLSFQKLSEGPRGACLLDHLDISFLRDGTKLPAGVEPVLTYPPPCDEEPEEEDISWLVKLEEAYKQPCWIKPRFLRSLSPLEDTVIARLQLSGGTFRTFELHQDEWVFPSLPRFRELVQLEN
jgi:hypothetical protein